MTTAVLERVQQTPPSLQAPSGRRIAFAKPQGADELCRVLSPQITPTMVAEALDAMADLWAQITPLIGLPRTLLNYGGRVVTALIENAAQHDLTTIAGLVAWDAVGYGSALYRIGKVPLAVDGYSYPSTALQTGAGYVRALRIGQDMYVLHTPNLADWQLHTYRGDPWSNPDVNAFESPEVDALQRTLQGLRNLDTSNP